MAWFVVVRYDYEPPELTLYALAELTVLVIRAVLAFVGAPASFPVQAENVWLHKFLKWNERMTKAADDFIRDHLPKGPVVGIHLRNGIDWVCGRLLEFKTRDECVTKWVHKEI